MSMKSSHCTPIKKYNDGRTKQAFKGECDINQIMARAAQGGTISHLAKYEPIYADFSEFDFHEHLTKLTQGREVFDSLPAEIRREFGQSPQAFFNYVNDPANINDLAKKLPGLARPGTQLPKMSAPNADEDKAALTAAKALVAASEPASEPSPTPVVKTTPPASGAPGEAT